MLIRRRWASFTMNMASLLCVIFFISIVATPSFYGNSGNYELRTKLPINNSRNTILIIQEGKTYFIEENSISELLSDLERSFIASRSIQNFQHLILRFLNILLPFAGFCVLVCCFGYFNRKKVRPKSIMALSMGGHAPPQIA